ncbi:Uncharacterised protein [Salmonella enterica subsp. enterica serovar Bovismorbificans]|nr:Uncharacterised protein [Salmonella enterica subsp. enterica serovar Bovismorbificans]
MLVVILSITGCWLSSTSLTLAVLSLITEVNVLTLFELCLTSSDRFFTSFEITLKPRPASPTRAASIAELIAIKLVWLAIFCISLIHALICVKEVFKSPIRQPISDEVVPISVINSTSDFNELLALSFCSLSSLMRSFSMLSCSQDLMMALRMISIVEIPIRIF